jgi:hypothetical protein
MFTIRFIRGPRTGYTSFAAVSYDVVPHDNKVEVEMEMPDGGTATETVGPGEEYKLAYVTNVEGKTIDKIAVAVG